MPDTPQSPTTSAPVSQDRPRGYEDPWVAWKDVQQTYIDWTKRLSETSFHLSLALVGANWAVFGADSIGNNVWSKYSLVVVIVGLVINLIGTKFMGEILGERFDYAKADPSRWGKEWKKEYGGAEDHWPFTAKSDKLARFLREVKLWFPLVAGFLFLVALTTYHPHK